MRGKFFAAGDVSISFLGVGALSRYQFVFLVSVRFFQRCGCGLRFGGEKCFLLKALFKSRDKLNFEIATHTYLGSPGTFLGISLSEMRVLF